MGILHPAFLKNNIALTFACDQAYLPYASVLLDSILDSSQEDHNYDIFLLHEGTLKGIEKLKNQVRSKENVSLRTLNLSDYLGLFDLRVHSHLSRATYYRLCLPLLFKEYERIIYLDVDTLVLKDLALLYKTDLKGKALGACIDLTQQLWIKEGKKLYYPYFTGKAEAYLRDYLQLKDPYIYFQAGVLLFDLDKQRQEKLTEKLFGILGQKKPLHWLDQDIFNIVFNEHGFTQLALAWNFIYYHTLGERLPEWQELYEQAQAETAIIHYASSYKPWFYPKAPFAKVWWQKANKSPFINDIRVQLAQHHKFNKRIQRKVLSFFNDETKLGILARQLRTIFYKVK